MKSEKELKDNKAKAHRELCKLADSVMKSVTKMEYEDAVEDAGRLIANIGATIYLAHILDE